MDISRVKNLNWVFKTNIYAKKVRQSLYSLDMYQNVYVAQLSQVAILGASNFDVFHALISIQSCADMVHVY